MAYSSHRAPSALRPAQTAQLSEQNIADALKISELQYRRLFEAARDGILILETEHGTITDANPFMTELLGYSHEELLGKELWEIGLLKDKSAGQAAFRQLKQEGYIRYEDLPLRNRTGDRREVEFVSNVYRESEHVVIQCNIRDITDRKRIEAELAIAAARNERIAETLQRSMLQASPQGKFSGVEVETLYAAAMNEAEVGGDFFDAFAVKDGRVALVVGDVSGKGLIAAGRTAEVKYALRYLLHQHVDPDFALGRLNDFICETHRLDTDNTEAFVILAVAVIDPANGRATLSAAGAEPTLILRLGDIAEPIEVVGSPLGIIPGYVYSARSTVLAPGETIVMATDGITEARNGHAFLGTDGMGSLAETVGSGTSLVEMIQFIYSGAKSFASGNLLRDDVCLLLARRSTRPT